MSVIIDTNRSLETKTLRILENGKFRILEQGEEMSDNVEGIRFTVNDVMDRIGIPYGYARTLLYRLFNWPQDINLMGVEIVIGADTDLYKSINSKALVKGILKTNEPLTKETLLTYIEVSSKSIIDLSTWTKNEILPMV